MMGTPSLIPNKPIGGKPVFNSARFKFGIIGLILGIPGFGISGSTLFLIYIIMMAGGGLDIMLTSTQERAIIIVLYSGLFFGMVGGILGVVGIIRGENKLVSIISIMLGVLMLCICSAITLLMFI